MLGADVAYVQWGSRWSRGPALGRLCWMKSGLGPTLRLTRLKAEGRLGAETLAAGWVV